MKGFKAFEKGLICRGKQYAENAVFEEERAVICNSGMHFCENPFDVLDYYPLVNDNGAFSDFAEVEALADVKTDDNKKFCTTKLKVGAKLAFPAFIKACVDFTVEKTTVDIPDSKVNDKDESVISSKTRNAKIGSSGNSAKIGSSGDFAQINSSGKNAVVMCAGNDSIAKAKIGSWITLSEWKYINNEYTPVCVKTEKVDGERIKEDTFYKLVNGEFTEV